MLGQHHKDSRLAWVVAFGAHLCKLLHDGLLKSFGVMLPSLSSEFNTSNWVVGLSISLMIVVGGLFAVIANPFLKRFQPRLLLIVFAILIFIGFILCAFSSSWTTFSIALIVVIGIPLRLSWYLMLTSLADYFEKHYTVANSIAYLGSSVALVIFAPLTQYLLNTYGLKGTLLVLGSISLHVSICGAVLKSSKSYQNITYSSDSNEENNFTSYIWKVVKEIFDTKLFVQPLFLAMLAAEFGTQYCFAGWVIYLVSYATSIGLSPYYATTLSASGGAGSFIGTLAISLIFKITDNTVYVFMSFLAIAGFSLLIYPLSSSFPILVAASFVFGMAVNACMVACMVLAKSLEGHQSSIVAWIICASSFGRLLAGFLTGWIRDVTGSYIISFMILGGVMLSSTCVFAVLACIGITKRTS
ncbi:monocarboxylate transporter 13-like [Amphiura filiformis]|uniref:monocarboxylate transporter 13-like n=1 Tax=Amphiura filiformis TaxID=82378 RepID=UPI003B225841